MLNSLLESSDTAVRISAGQAIALLFELARDLDSEDEDVCTILCTCTCTLNYYTSDTVVLFSGTVCVYNYVGIRCVASVIMILLKNYL